MKVYVVLSSICLFAYSMEKPSMLVPMSPKSSLFHYRSVQINVKPIDIDFRLSVPDTISIKYANTHLYDAVHALVSEMMNGDGQKLLNCAALFYTQALCTGVPHDQTKAQAMRRYLKRGIKNLDDTRNTMKKHRKASLSTYHYTNQVITSYSDAKGREKYEEEIAENLNNKLALQVALVYVKKNKEKLNLMPSI